MSGSIATLFRKLSHGVYVIGVNDGNTHNAFTAAWLMQVSFDPLQIALSINPHNSSWRMLQTAGRFSVNILNKDQIELAAHFGKPAAEQNKLSAVEWRYSPKQMPILNDALAWLDCAYSHEVPAGDHILVVATVTDGKLQSPEAKPLGYQDTGEIDGSSLLYPENFK